ncbi:MAG: hypothetical protein CMO20_01380 [Thermoplasmata archaeon]|nr:hypothetical protein [Thermoplasmata archaeon]
MRTRAFLVLAMLLVATALSGCLGVGSDDNSDRENDPFNVPTWKIGDWWLYTFTTPEFSDDTARLVVSENDTEDGTAYNLAISNHVEARRHAVLNHNPFLGRITHDNLSAYENGVPQPVFQFPFQKGDSWNFTLFSVEWDANVLEVHIENDGVTSQRIAVISASSTDGSTLSYIFDEGAGFLRSLIWIDSEGVEQLNMQLASFGKGHEGEVWFIRASDLFANSWSGPDVDVRDTFFVGDHPSGVEYDEMIYYLNANMGGGTGTLTLRDHSSVSALERAWQPGESEEGQLGEINAPSQDYTLTVTLTGQSEISIIIAGGITSSWVL